MLAWWRDALGYCTILREGKTEGWLKFSEFVWSDELMVELIIQIMKANEFGRVQKLVGEQ